MVENLKIEGIKDYPIKWICNFRGQKAIGICGYSQKIAMFAADSRVSKILEDIVIGFCEIKPRQYLQITGKKPSNKNIKELEQGLESLNLEIKQKNLVPFDNYEIVDFKED